MAKKKLLGRRGPYDADDPTQFGTLGIKLRQWRLFLEMTIEELAEAAKVSTGTISGIEAGGSGFSKESLPKLANALGVTIGQLFDVNPLADREFWTIWREANSSQRQRIHDFAHGLIDKT